MRAKLTDQAKEASKALHARLLVDHPHTFSGSEDKPFERQALLKIGIHKDLVAAYPDVSMTTIRNFIHWYVFTPEYLALASEAGRERLDLAGNRDGAVTSLEAEHSKTLLAAIEARKNGKPVRAKAPAKTD